MVLIGDDVGETAGESITGLTGVSGSAESSLGFLILARSVSCVWVRGREME